MNTELPRGHKTFNHSARKNVPQGRYPYEAIYALSFICMYVRNIPEYIFFIAREV